MTATMARRLQIAKQRGETMNYLNFGILFSIVGLFTLPAHGATPSASHKELGQQLDNGIEWAKHLRTEAKKGRKMDSQHLDEETKNTQDSLAAMQVAAEKILSEAPSEKKEGHFMEMQKYREAASASLKDFVAAKQEPRRNYSAMKSAAGKILKNLEDAKHWHDLELSEIEHNPKD